MDDGPNDIQMLYRDGVSDCEDYSSDDAQDLEKRTDKNIRQWKRWTEIVIPEMLQPYMTLLHETDSLRNLETTRKTPSCNGCDKGRMLNVICIYFNSK